MRLSDCIFEPRDSDYEFADCLVDAISRPFVTKTPARARDPRVCAGEKQQKIEVSVFDPKEKELD